MIGLVPTLLIGYGIVPILLLLSFVLGSAGIVKANKNNEKISSNDYWIYVTTVTAGAVSCIGTAYYAYRFSEIDGPLRLEDHVFLLFSAILTFFSTVLLYYCGYKISKDNW